MTDSSSSINLNEDDWVQLLQNLTPSSINSLQQTLKRLQKPEPKPATPSVTESHVHSAANPNPSVMVTLDTNRTSVQPVINVPSVLNIASKHAINTMPNAIVLPTSTFLIQPPNQCQTFALDSCVPVTDLAHLVVSSNSLSNQLGLEQMTTPKTPETFNSLNTLANAAVAMAARTPFQWPAVSTGSPTAPAETLAINTSTSLANINCLNVLALSSSSASELTIPSISPSHRLLNPQPLLPNLTVYHPIEVSSHGPTVLLTAAPTTQGLSTLPANFPTPSSTTCTPVKDATTISSPMQTSTPRGKPKFKALWELDSAYSSATNTVNESIRDSNSQTAPMDDHATTNRILKHPSPSIQSVGHTPKRMAVVTSGTVYDGSSSTQTAVKTTEADGGFNANDLNEERNVGAVDCLPSLIDYSEHEPCLGKTYESGRRNLKEESVSDDEAKRRAKRRERNRVAAAKCRQRRQDQIEELQHRVDVLTKTGQDLHSSLRWFNLERARLETLVREHKVAGCPEAEKILSNNSTYLEPVEDSKEFLAGMEPTSTTMIRDQSLNDKPKLSSAEDSNITHDTSKSNIASRPPVPKLDLCLAVKHVNQLNSVNFNPQTVSETNSAGYTKLSALRPSTLMPFTSTPLTSVMTNVKNSAPNTCLSGASTPCFWPSELQTFSPILTPSTWKLLKKLNTAVGATTTTTPTTALGDANVDQPILVTPTFHPFYPTLLHQQSMTSNGTTVTNGLTSIGYSGGSTTHNAPVLTIENLNSNIVINQLESTLQSNAKVKVGQEPANTDDKQKELAATDLSQMSNEQNFAQLKGQ